MDHQFKRLLNLVRRTGDRLVVTDPNGEDTYVLMGLEAYEKIAKQTAVSEFDEWDSDDFDDYCGEEDCLKDCGDFECCGADCADCLSCDSELKKDRWDLPKDLVDAGSEYHSAFVNDNLEETAQEQAVPAFQDIWSNMPEAGSQSETWDVNKFGESEQKIVEEKFGEKPVFESEAAPIITQESVPEEQKEAEFSQENVVIESKKDDEDLGEEQFYLEPVE